MGLRRGNGTELSPIKTTRKRRLRFILHDFLLAQRPPDTYDHCATHPIHQAISKRHGG